MSFTVKEFNDHLAKICDECKGITDVEVVRDHIKDSLKKFAPDMIDDFKVTVYDDHSILLDYKDCHLCLFSMNFEGCYGYPSCRFLGDWHTGGNIIYFKDQDQNIPFTEAVRSIAKRIYDEKVPFLENEIKKLEKKVLKAQAELDKYKDRLDKMHRYYKETWGNTIKLPETKNMPQFEYAKCAISLNPEVNPGKVLEFLFTDCNVVLRDSELRELQEGLPLFTPSVEELIDLEEQNERNCWENER